MLTKTEIEDLFTTTMQAARRRLHAGDLENATRRAAFANGLAAALDCPDRKTLAAELLSELSILQRRKP
jgi:hypothetical protein